MSELSATERLLVIARSKRSNAINERNRALLNIEITERAAITAEAKVAASDAEVDALLDRLLVERAARVTADKLVKS